MRHPIEHDLRELPAERFELLFRCTRRQHTLPSCRKPARDPQHLLHRFAGAENHLGMAAARRPVVVDVGIAKRLKREVS